MRRLPLARAAEPDRVDVVARAAPCSLCCRALARRARRAVHPQAWYVRALDALRATYGPAHPDIISTLMSYGRLLGAHRGWQHAAKTLWDAMAQLEAAGQGQSEGAPSLLAHPGRASDSPAAHLAGSGSHGTCSKAGRDAPALVIALHRHPRCCI